MAMPARAATRIMTFRLPVTLIEALDRYVEQRRALDPMVNRTDALRVLLIERLRELGIELGEGGKKSTTTRPKNRK
jgi:hypothetical protein